MRVRGLGCASNGQEVSITVVTVKQTRTECLLLYCLDWKNIEIVQISKHRKLLISFILLHNKLEQFLK